MDFSFSPFQKGIAYLFQSTPQQFTDCSPGSSLGTGTKPPNSSVPRAEPATSPQKYGFGESSPGLRASDLPYPLPTTSQASFQHSNHTSQPTTQNCGFSLRLKCSIIEKKSAAILQTQLKPKTLAKIIPSPFWSLTSPSRECWSRGWVFPPKSHRIGLLPPLTLRPLPFC